MEKPRFHKKKSVTKDRANLSAQCSNITNSTPKKNSSSTIINLDQFDYLRYSLVDFVNNFPGCAHIKDAQTFSYLFCNDINLRFHGLNSESELIGKTVFDLDKIPDHFPKGFAQSIQELEYMVLKTRNPLVDKHKLFPDNNGFAATHTLMKIPLFDYKKNIKGILSLSFDTTPEKNIKELYELYKVLYKNNKIKNVKFLTHIGFKTQEPLSDQEIECLIELSGHRTFKAAANAMKLSVKTIETYLYRILHKTSFQNTNQLIEKFISINNSRGIIIT